MRWPRSTYRNSHKPMKSIIVALFIIASAFRVVGQYAPNPFPTNTPVVGYEFQPAFTALNFGSNNRHVGLDVIGGRLFVRSKTQVASVVTNTAAPTRTVFLNNSSIAWSQVDSGFPGFAFHPSGKWVFTFGCETNAATGGLEDVLRKWTVDPANTNRVTPASEVLLAQADRSSEHLGGAMWFGPDGYLYITLSDEGGQNGVLGNTQKIDANFFSGVIRIDVDNRPENLVPNPHPAIRGLYRVPADNPWVGATSFNGSAVDPAKVRTEFFAVGLRNPHTVVRDPVSGRVFVGDVGNLRWESVFELQRGANYGWNWYEGPEATAFKEAPPISSRPAVQFTPPFWTYPHDAIATSVGQTDKRYAGNCIILGMVYRGSKYPELDGKLIASDFVAGHVWAITLGQTPSVQWIGSTPAAAAAWAVDPATGDILMASPLGTLWRMVPAAPAALPRTLSATGVFASTASFALNPGPWPYEVANPFWSDGAVKARWFALPTNGVIARDSTEEWATPTGTWWMKHFDIEGRRIETRFLVRTQTGAYGVTYRWRNDQSDADLVPYNGADTVLPNGQPWRFPSWSECATCHNQPGGANGFSTRQLNTTIQALGVGTVNQLEEYSLRGALVPPVASAAGLPKLSRPGDASFSLAHRFKSYTDANCAYCHYPGGPGRGEWDGRFSTPLELSGIINGPVGSDLGFAGAAVIAPGDTNRSVLFHRIGDWGPAGQAEYGMPPLATFRPNADAISMVAEFIRSLAPRTNWSVGLPGPAAEPWGEFSVENRLNDAAPGSSSALDDDFYTAGSYPAGFNGLTAPLVVEADEPAVNWERSLTHKDATNRLHFVTTEGPATLVFGFSRGAALSNGVAQATVIHNVTVNHRTSTGETTLWTGQISASGVLTIPLVAADGANTIEFIRTGPSLLGWSYWMTFDYVRVQR